MKPVGQIHVLDFVGQVEFAPEILVEELQVEFVGRELREGRFDFDGRDVILGHVHGLGPKLVELLEGEVVVGAVLQLDVELQIVLQARLGEVARTGDDAAFVAVALVERHDVELGVNALRRISADFQFAGLDPLHELADAVFNVRTVAGLLEFAQDFARHALPTWA